MQRRNRCSGGGAEARLCGGHLEAGHEDADVLGALDRQQHHPCRLPLACSAALPSGARARPLGLLTRLLDGKLGLQGRKV